MKQPELGQKISELRKQNNMTQAEIAERCYVNVRSIQRNQGGRGRPENAHSANAFKDAKF